MAANRRGTEELIVPPGVSRGDTIGLIAPAAAVDPQAVEQARVVLEGWGYKVELGRNLQSRHRYLAGTADQRLGDLEGMIRDRTIRAIICARGGYGSVDLLPRLDPELVRANPKLVCGYSDVAVLVNFIACSCRVASLHGPMAVSELARGMVGAASTRLRALLSDARAAWVETGLEGVRPGRASGPVVGGCLSSIVSLVGTPFAIDTAGKVLFLEEVGEKAYRVERMLTQLRLAGHLSAPAAVVLGSLAGSDGGENSDIIESLVHEIFAGAGYPVVAGFPAGHESDQMAFTIGLPVEVDGKLGVVKSAGGPTELRRSRSRN